MLKHGPQVRNTCCFQHLEKYPKSGYISVRSGQLGLHITADPWRIRKWSLKGKCSWMVHLHFSCTPFLQRVIGLAVIRCWSRAVRRFISTECALQWPTFFRQRAPRGGQASPGLWSRGHAPRLAWRRCRCPHFKPAPARRLHHSIFISHLSQRWANAARHCRPSIAAAVRARHRENALPRPPIAPPWSPLPFPPC